MAGRIRSLKPEFFRSPDITRLDYPVRIFYQALWCWADDFGVGETNFNGLLGFAFGDGDQVYDEELRDFRAISAPDLRRFCADCARVLRVTFYTVRGRHYYAIPTWREHQKTETRHDRRKYPGPDDPDAAPDQRIHPRADSAPISRQTSGADPCETGAGTGEQGNRGTGESLPQLRTDVQTAPAPAKRGREGSLARFQQLNEAAASPLALQASQALSDTLRQPLPFKTQTGVANAIDECLEAGIALDAIPAGFQEWTNSDSFSPTQLPHYVHKANNRLPPGKATNKAVNYGDTLIELIKEIPA